MDSADLVETQLTSVDIPVHGVDLDPVVHRLHKSTAPAGGAFDSVLAARLQSARLIHPADLGIDSRARAGEAAAALINTVSWHSSPAPEALARMDATEEPHRMGSVDTARGNGTEATIVNT